MSATSIPGSTGFGCLCTTQDENQSLLYIAVSAIFEFSGNEFELDEIKFERERQTHYLLNKTVTSKERHNILEET
jgi:hypothetical protein